MRDAIELEIAKNALTSIADEMAVVALKSAFSIILKESGDASSAICDRYGAWSHRPPARRYTIWPVSAPRCAS